MPETPELAIVIPCLNEAENLRRLLPSIAAVTAELDVSSRTFVMDGGSTDNSTETAEKLGATVIRVQGYGYGAALRAAFTEIRAPFLITLDADFSHHPAIIKYLFHQRGEAEIIVASRYVQGGYGATPWIRTAASRLFNACLRNALSVPVHDLSSGFRLYHREAAAALHLRQNGFGILQEILVKAYCMGYRIIETPFHYRGNRPSGRRRPLRLALDSLRVLARMWRIRNSIESADYDTRAFHSRIPLQRWWQRKRYHIILNYIGDRLRVLDAGCGSSQILTGAPQMVGLDLRLRKLRFMRRPGRRLIRGNIFALPFQDEAFEAVVCSQVIEHVPDRPVLFQELFRVLKPGGSLIVGTPDYGSWQWPLIEKLYRAVHPGGYADEHITHYTRKGLISRLESLGLVIEDEAYIARGEMILHARKPARAAPPPRVLDTGVSSV